jgi:hypothetical protein
MCRADLRNSLFLNALIVSVSRLFWLASCSAIQVMRNAVIALGAIVGVCLAGSFAWAAQEPSAAVYAAQSEYLRSFADFIDWPAPTANSATDGTINFCVLGRDPYGELLDKSVLFHPVGERRTIITRGRHLGDLGACDVLFISSSEAKHEAKILKSVGHKDILTVGDADDFAARGGIIQFVTIQEQVSFLINVDAAQRAGLRIKAPLLALAKIVHDGPVKGGE